MSAPHGTKRPADSSLDGEQRLSKRFDLLNLDHAKRLYIPVASSTKPTSPCTTSRPPADDCMHVEDTPHRVYIHDLAAELDSIESDSDTPVFLSDIEKHLSKIPRHVLLGPPPKPTEHNQVVLYNVPASLTVPAEQDNVRKAIVEARQRIREKQVSGVTELETAVGVPGHGPEEVAEVDDADAMDLD